MDAKVQDFKELKKSINRRNRQIKFEEFKKNACEFWNNNKDVIIVILPLAVGVVTKVVTGVNRSIRLKKETQLHDNYCYDRSLGHYWKLRRELTNDEWTIIDKRKANGERLGDILQSLKVLK